LVGGVRWLHNKLNFCSHLENKLSGARSPMELDKEQSESLIDVQCLDATEPRWCRKERAQKRQSPEDLMAQRQLLLLRSQSSVDCGTFFKLKVLTALLAPINMKGCLHHSMWHMAQAPSASTSFSSILILKSRDPPIFILLWVMTHSLRTTVFYGLSNHSVEKHKFVATISANHYV
ncbi:hypothetical protein T05_1660, partial [Trichinella murrelli]